MARPDARRALLCFRQGRHRRTRARAARVRFRADLDGRHRARDRGGGPAGHRGRRSSTGSPEIAGRAREDAAPGVHGALLGRAGTDDAVMREQGIAPIELLVDNPLPVCADDRGARLAATKTCIENIDVGGPAMPRAAAKNHERVGGARRPGGLRRRRLRSCAPRCHRGDAPGASRQRRSAIRPSTTPSVSGWLRREQGDAIVPGRLCGGLSAKLQDLRYGENPHQSRGLYVDPLAAGVIHRDGEATPRQGTLLQQHRGCETRRSSRVRQFAAPACVIVKHANPAGAAYRPAVEGPTCEPTKGYDIRLRRIIAFNRPFNAGTAAAILERQFVEVIVAPAFAPEALAALGRKENIRLLDRSARTRDAAAIELRSVAGAAAGADRDDGPSMSRC